jgi:hypothetical protein
MTGKRTATRRPHKLELYRRAVQHPMAEAAFLHRAYLNYAKGDPPLLLREDFAGTCAVASAWIMMDDEHQAMAVEAHGPTTRWAQRTSDRELGDRADDLHIVEADVLDVDGPKVDITCALNFSTFMYHDRASLKQYFKAARRGLRRDGLLVIDAYGGPGAMRVGTQTRAVPPPPDVPRELTSNAPSGAPTVKASGQPGFTYHWEQRSFDPSSHRTECRIHFEMDDGKRVNSAFIYRWRLWTLPELIEVMLEAGFKRSTAWCDRYDSEVGTSDGIYRPIRQMPAREDWVAYVVGVK